MNGTTSTFVEGLRSLRTALLLSRSGRPPKVILVASPLEGEGKTTLALNLAALLAHQGERVLLVDADLRRPSLHRLAGIVPVDTVVESLSAALASDRSPTVIIPSQSLPTLGMVLGDVAPYPAELLGSPRMKKLVQIWRKSFDFIVLDSAPILPVTDSILLSQLSDATLLIARHGVTTKQALRRSLDALRTQQAVHSPVGIVLNGVAHDSEDFYEYFGFEGGKYAQKTAQA